MGKGLPRSLARGGSQMPVFKKTYIAENLSITVNGATGVGYGSAVLGGLPEGNVVLLGAVSYMKFAPLSSTNPTTTWDGDYGIGTTAPDDATITGADVNVVSSTALGAATARVSPRKRGVTAAGLAGIVIDNTGADVSLNLSLLVDDANISADSIVFLANGELQLIFGVLGDD